MTHQTSTPNFFGGGGSIGGSGGALSGPDASGDFIMPSADTDGQLVLDSSGHFVVKKHPFFNIP